MTVHNDGSGPEQPRDDRPLTLPGLKSAVARRVRYEKPRRFFAHGKERAESEAIEIDVETDAEFPVAGMGPALIVGNLPITDSTRVGERRYRFFAPSSAPIEKRAMVTLGRAGTGVPKPETRGTVRLEWSEE
ncbi:hypothetical protein [Pyxidicoccus caerfyrddinensis]|uniref:hypothetical protein n=1 Tax=Pyxidicoccus caerfyrddinensis TaxID=2709663 RepID=UPI0013D92CF1|nr:hypothetical protein [Pyxidicoccus caerfyrddinensis]